MKQVNKHPRKTRTYKTTDVVYKRAMRRAKKEKTTLAGMIDRFTTLYGLGCEIKIASTPTNA